MKSLKKVLIFSFLLGCCSGCFQAYSNGDQEELRTVPVTNNPHIVPQVPGGIPGSHF